MPTSKGKGVGREGKGAGVRGGGIGLEREGKGRQGRGRRGGERRGGKYRHFFLYTLSTASNKLIELLNNDCSVSIQVT